MAETEKRKTSGSEGRGSNSSSRGRSTSATATQKRRQPKRIVETLGALGVSEDLVDGVKSYVVSSVEGKLRDLDVEESIEKAGEMAKRSLSSVRRYSSNRPGLFFGGLLTVALGAGLLIGAAMNDDVEYELEFEPEEF